MPGEFFALPGRLLCSACVKQVEFGKRLTPEGQLTAMCTTRGCTQANVLYRYEVPRVPVYVYNDGDIVTISVAQGELP